MFCVEIPELGPTERSTPSEHVNLSNLQGLRHHPTFGPAPSSKFHWAIKSMRIPKLGLPGNVAYVGKHPTWEPMEAKAGPLEVMTLAPSLRQEYTDNYSGEGKGQDTENGNTPTARSVSGEEKETEGSGEGSNLQGGFGMKVNNLDSSGIKLIPEPKSSLSLSDFVTVAERTTLSQWQLVEQPTTPPQGSQETEKAEEARGEILYIHGPTDSISSTSSNSREDSGFTTASRKHSKGESSNEVMITTPETLMELLTTSDMTTAELLASEAQTKEPATTATIIDNKSYTEESSISISWVQEDREKATSLPSMHDRLSATPAPQGASLTTSGVVQFTTVIPDIKVAATEMESRSAVSESFVVGSRWTPFKDLKSEEHKMPATTDDKHTNNPFGILVPSWEFGLIPSGKLASKCA